eukprot:TRINITY_DN769_c0_g1_i2.p2 TRINITY_DN769_c0_g1~~TRINITY_DN769_c0_g1_i2.p2  ORF type:complete len:64 (+),score=2.47 TRINITY_DN769_c0_g1_i2:183-374(+)
MRGYRLPGNFTYGKFRDFRQMSDLCLLLSLEVHHQNPILVANHVQKNSPNSKSMKARNFFYLN